MKRFRAIFFDMGHTLVYNEPSPTDYLRQELGLEVSSEKALSALGQTWTRIGEEYLARDGDLSPDFPFRFYGIWLEETGVRENLNHYLPKLRRALQSYRYERLSPPEVPRTLSELKRRGYRMGVISNWDDSLERICQEKGLAKYFEAILASEVVGVEKPNQRIFELALERLGVQAEEAMHVGDNYYADVIGARGVGITPVLLDRRGLFPEVDCLRIERMEELPTLL